MLYLKITIFKNGGIILKKNYGKGKKSYSTVSKGKHFSQSKGFIQKIKDFTLTKEYQQELHDKKADSLKNVSKDINSDVHSQNVQIENFFNFFQKRA